MQNKLQKYKLIMQICTQATFNENVSTKYSKKTQIDNDTDHSIDKRITCAG